MGLCSSKHVQDTGDKERIVIIGAGFGGLSCAQGLKDVMENNLASLTYVVRLSMF